MRRADPNHIVAANVRRLRLARGWSQEVFADRCGLHRTYIGAIERSEGNITLRTLARLAEALECTCEALLCKSHGKVRR